MPYSFLLGGILAGNRLLLAWAGHLHRETALQEAERHVLETFTPTEDGSRLHRTAEVTDPVMLTDVVKYGRYWDWRPEIQVQPCNCDKDQGLDQ